MNTEVWTETRIEGILFSVFIALIPGLQPAAEPRNVIRSNVRKLNKGAAHRNPLIGSLDAAEECSGATHFKCTAWPKCYRRFAALPLVVA